MKDSFCLRVDQSTKLTDRVVCELSNKSLFTVKWKVPFWPTHLVVILTLTRTQKVMKHLPFQLDPAASRTNLLTSASGKIRTAFYTTGKWSELGFGLRLGSGLGLWFRLGFCQHPYASCLPTVRSAIQ